MRIYAADNYIPSITSRILTKEHLHIMLQISVVWNELFTVTIMEIRLLPTAE